jgi:hypothetical protein
LLHRQGVCRHLFFGSLHRRSEEIHHVAITHSLGRSRLLTRYSFQTGQTFPRLSDLMSPYAKTPTMAGRSTDRVHRPFDDTDQRGEPLCDDGAWSYRVPPSDAVDTRLVPRAPGFVSPERAP